MPSSIKIRERASFLGDAVFAGSDGIVTTFAIVAGSAGASLDNKIVLILGFANLFADGISMAAGNFLGVKSETEYEVVRGDKEDNPGSPFVHGLVTFIAFNLAGFLPLAPYVFRLRPEFSISLIFVVFALFLIGVLRSAFTKKEWFKGGMETLFIGGFAALVAYLVGSFVEIYVQ